MPTKMTKDFDNWNKEKQVIHERTLEEEFFYRAREMWWCSLGVNVGFEQDGTGQGYERPVLILKGFSRQVCLVIPMTTSLKTNPYHVSLGLVDGRQSSAIISQLRLIDTKRLSNKIGLLDQAVFETIRKAVKDLL